MKHLSRRESRRVRRRERTCSREAGRRSETFLRRLFVSSWRRRFVFAPLRRRRHQHPTSTGQGARLLRRRGRQHPPPRLRGQGRRRHLAAGASTIRPRWRVDAFGPRGLGAGCWRPAGRPGLHGRRRRPRLRARRAAVSSRPARGGAWQSSSRDHEAGPSPLRPRPGRSDAGDLHRRRELEVVRRRRRLVDDLHLAGRGGAAAGAGVAASAEVEDDGPVSVA